MIKLTMSGDLLTQRKVRLEKVKKLRELGFNPYPTKAQRTHTIKEVLLDFEKLSESNQQVTITGRLMIIRDFGKIKFFRVQDATETIQVVIKKDDLLESDPKKNQLGWELLKLLDRGDFIEVTGTVGTTKTGEKSVFAKSVKILTKALRPLPEKWHGIKDEETRVRRRYLDMAIHPEIRERMIRRSKFWQAVRDFLNSKGFIEINTPILEHVPGGADARPFVTYYDALEENFYLRISHELALKRLLGAGFEKVYDIGHRFRNEGFSPEHLPEHIAMEWYWAYADHKDGMALTKEMFVYIVEQVYGTYKFEVKGMTVDFDPKKEWEEVDMVEIIKSEFGVDILHDPEEKLYYVLKEKTDIRLEDGQVNRSRLADNLWKAIRKHIAGPIFLVGVPKYLSPLAKADPEDPEKALRFHLVAAGSELTNAFAELNDPVEQLERFVEQQKLREAGDEEAHMMDIDFVEMLEWGMPPAVGFGMSERVFWILEGVTAREGVPFPPYKYDLDETTRKIYKDILHYIDKKAIKGKKK